jgi:nucleotide-binding universal stress UspA family protein
VAVKILVLVKEMPRDEATVSFSNLVARATRSAVTLLHVTLSEADQPVGESTLDRARKMLPDVPVDTRLRQGGTVGRILDEIGEGDYDLVIVGARQGVNPMRHSLGSVARAIFRHASISVLVVNQARESLERLLICAGGIGAVEPVIERGARLAQAANAQATLLHVASPAPSMYTGLTEIEEPLSELLQTDTPIARYLRRGAETLADLGVKAALQLRRGVASNEILREAAKGDYDLIAIGASATKGPLTAYLLSDVTRQVVDHAPCPVLVVK